MSKLRKIIIPEEEKIINSIMTPNDGLIFLQTLKLLLVSLSKKINNPSTNFLTLELNEKSSVNEVSKLMSEYNASAGEIITIIRHGKSNIIKNIHFFTKKHFSILPTKNCDNNIKTHDEKKKQ